MTLLLTMHRLENLFLRITVRPYYIGQIISFTGKSDFQISPPTEIPRCSNHMRGSTPKSTGRCKRETPIHVLASSGKRAKAVRRWIGSYSLSPDFGSGAPNRDRLPGRGGTGRKLSSKFDSAFYVRSRSYRYGLLIWWAVTPVHRRYIMGEYLSS